MIEWTNTKSFPKLSSNQSESEREEEDWLNEWISGWRTFANGMKIMENSVVRECKEK